MAKDPKEPSGRVAFDDRGSPTWEWRIDAGTFSREIDTQRLRILQERMGITLAEPAGPVSGHDPYSTASAPQEQPRAPRRTLDDMRRLSEEIKRARAAKKQSE